MTAALHTESRSNSWYPFIALEGCDGVGKSSIRDVLRDALVRRGMKCIMVGQHSWLNTMVGRLIYDVRELRIKHSPGQVAEAYRVDKRLHAEHTIAPALKDAAVIADRYIVSDAVYQEVLYGITAESTLENHYAQGTLFPDLIIYIQVDCDEAYRRVRKRSKHTRHYERPARMSHIMRVYDRILLSERLPFIPELVQFRNDLPNWRERVELDLLPNVERACEAARTRTTR